MSPSAAAVADVKAHRGETVGLRLDPAGCHLFPATI